MDEEHSEISYRSNNPFYSLLFASYTHFGFNPTIYVQSLIRGDVYRVSRFRVAKTEQG